METTVSNSVLRLALQLVLLIAAVRGKPWCSRDLTTVEPGSEGVEFVITAVTCDSNNNPKVDWIANGNICWGYSCNDGQEQGLFGECEHGGSFSPSSEDILLQVAGKTQCSYYLCIEISSNFREYRINYTVSCPDNPATTITSSIASLQYSNSTAVTTPSHTPDISHQLATSTHQTLTPSSSATSATTTIASETSASETSASETSASEIITRETSTSVITSEVTTQHTMKITLTSLIPSTTPSTQTPTDAQVDATLIVLSVSILGVLLIMLLIVLLCSTMFKRYYRNWQHKIVFDGGMPDWEPFDTIVTLSISISTLTEPLEKYETKIQMDTIVPESDDESDVASSVSSASEILGEPVKDFTRHHSNSEYVQVDGVQSAWDNSGSDQCSTLATTSSGYLEYQGSIGTSHRQLEYSSSVETSDGNFEYHDSNELVETSDGYLRQPDNQTPSTKDHHKLVATSSGYVQYRDSNETSEIGSNQNSGGYETSYQLDEDFVRTSGGYVQYKDCNKETTCEHTEYQGLAESISDYNIDNKDNSCGHMPYQELFDSSGGYLDGKDTICRHTPCQGLVDSSGGYTDGKDTSCGHMPCQGLVDNSGGYIIGSSYQQQRELVESSGGYVHYKDSQVDTNCRQIHHQDLVESDSGYIHYQDSNGYLHTNPI